MKKYNYFLLALVSVLLLTSQACHKNDADEAQLSLQASILELETGQQVVFNMNHNATNLVIFTGDAGHEHKKSALYILAGKTEEELKQNVYLKPDPAIVPLVVDFGQFTSGASAELAGYADLVSSPSLTSTSLLDDQARLVDDLDLGSKVLEVEALNPSGWAEYLRFYPNTKLGKNRKLKLRIKFESTQLTNTTNGLLDETGANSIQAHIRLSGHSAGEQEPTYDGSTVTNMRLTPSKSYTDYEFDISPVVEAWEKKVGKSMDYIDHINIMLRSANNLGYVGKFYVASVAFSDYDYFPFDQAHDIAVLNGSGVSSFSYTYNEPGNYEVVAIASNTGFQDYKTNHYDLSRAIKTVTIKVTDSKDEPDPELTPDPDSMENGNGAFENMNSDTGKWEE